MEKHYAERDIELLDDLGGYYFRHVCAMTGEGLHSKSDIAAELGYRDAQLAEANLAAVKAGEKANELRVALEGCLEMAHAVDNLGLIGVEWALLDAKIKELLA